MMKKTLAILMTAALLLLACPLAPCVAEGAEANPESTWALVSEAYAYAFPLVIMDATKTLSTNTETPVPGRAPVNQFIHAQKLADAQFRTVVTPNVDTIYTQAWLDVGSEPLLYVMPEADRFFNVQILDAWTNTVAVLKEAGVYAFALPDWTGELPDDAIRIDVPTATAWLIARIVLSGPEDLPNVYEIQQKMQLKPLSAYRTGGVYAAPAGVYSAENEFVPVEKVLSMGPADFFNTANALMQSNPPASDDAQILDRIAEINVGPGMEFDARILPGDVAGEWKQMLQQLRSKLLAESANYAVQLGQWKYFGPPIGDFGTEYVYRAMVALAGLGANTVDVAVYPKTDVDDTGARLAGDKTYVLHFETLPPILEGGFWSVTAYGSDDFLIDNPIDRYCVNDRTDFKLNEDGSLDVILSSVQPDDPANWLPVSGDAIHLYMRIYTPDMAALSNWQPPVVHAVDE